MELVVEGNLFHEGKVRRLAVGIEDGRIVQVKKVIKGHRSRDFGDRLIIPGAIDAHVHFREPGMTQKEDFLTGTTAAACGGVTTVLDMPNTRPSTVSLSDLKEKASLVRPRACVDFGLFAGLVPKSRPAATASLAIGHKLYMGSTTGDLLVDDYGALPGLLAQAGRTQRPVAVHAEDEPTIRSLGLKAADTSSYNDSRPPGCEAEAVHRFIGALGAASGHVCHVSSRRALELLGSLKSENAVKGPQPRQPASAATKNDNAAKQGTVTCELTPHHLFLDAREDRSLGAFGKVNPPLRKTEERRALWEAFLRGGIGVLASDHAPHLEEEKDVLFADAPAGVPGTETMLPLMMPLVKQGRLEPGVLVDAVCANPARIYGLRTGRILPGMPAHLAVFELTAGTQVRGKRLHSKCAWTPFEGREAIFPKAVFLAGEMIVEDWEPVVSPGRGAFLRPTQTLNNSVPDTAAGERDDRP
jgi:dihydroorotase